MNVELVHLTEFLGAAEEESPSDSLPPQPSVHLNFEIVRGVRMVKGRLAKGQFIRMLPGRDPIYRVDYVSDSRAYCVPITLRKLVGRHTGAEIPNHDGDFFYTVSGEGVNIAARAHVELIDPGTFGDALHRRAAHQRLSEGDPIPAYEDTDMASTSPIPVAKKSASVRRGRRSTDRAVRTPGTRATSNGSAKREAAPKTVRKCACGCGGETMGFFVPGHDAKYHGWERRLADGRIGSDGKDAKTGERVIGAKVIEAMGLKKKGEGYVPTVDYRGDKVGKA